MTPVTARVLILTALLSTPAFAAVDTATEAAIRRLEAALARQDAEISAQRARIEAQQREIAD